MAREAMAVRPPPGPGGGPDPLAVSYPSPMLLLNYPLFATNVKMLCEKDGWRCRASSSFMATFDALRLTFRTEGAVGLYRCGHLYLLHQIVRDAFRILVDRTYSMLDRWLAPKQLRSPGSSDEPGAEAGAGILAGPSAYRLRLATKYIIDALCYPVLLAATRGIILQGDDMSAWQRVCMWCKEEGPLSLFGGMSASLLSTAFDETMDMVLLKSIDMSSIGTDIDLADKLLLKASGSSVVSIFTAPINYVGVIQRCQSFLPGLLPPRPIGETIKGLPWRSSVWQFFMFSGILALNVKLIQWKLEVQALDNDEE